MEEGIKMLVLGIFTTGLLLGAAIGVLAGAVIF